MNRKFRIILALIVISCYTAAIAQNNMVVMLPMDNAVRFGKLPNGMTYYIMQNKKPENRVELRLAVNAGSTAEGDHQQGLAHMLEHLCFNGTKNFKKSELVDYLESIGTKFGPHLNAYTSFDETVYMIQLPTDKEEILTKGLQILEDWAHNVAFDSVEIEKERGVVVEEWRLGQGAQERARRQYWPVLFKNSRYAERLPIGKKEVIDTCSHKAITDFYKAWYRPDLMAIAIVGDIDVDKMEQLVKKQFAAIKASRNAMPIKEWEVQDNAKLEVAIAKDKELTTSMVQLVYKQPATSLKTEKDYRTSMCQSLISSIISSRLGERSKEPEPPFLFARGGYTGLVRTQNAFMLMAAAPPNGTDKALEALVTEALRIKRHGIIPSELERAKKSMMKDMEVSYNERDKRESRNLVSECVRHFLEGESMPGITAEYNLYKKLMPGITKQELDSMTNVYITEGYNAVAIMMVPDKAEVTMPVAEDIEARIKSIGMDEITPYMDMVTDAPLMEIIPAPIKVVSEKRIEKFNITEWKLANGATVVLKPTDFKNDQLLINAQRLGGHSNCEEDDEHRSALIAASLVDASGLGKMDATALEKYMMGRTANISPFVGEISEGFNGNCTPDDAELMFQMLHMYYTGIREDENMYLSMLSKQRSTLQNKSASPESNFRDTIGYVMSGYHKRSQPMTAERLSEISMDDAINFYKSRFAGVNGMVFTLVGNMDIAKPNR
ncbi:MAG: insulinase family protein [Bacteroidetes bacterium]|nr:insulinase family protein [Bacteroidota bacterium]